MATQTTNYNLSKPEATDPFSQFRQSYNDNMDIIDQNLGGGGGSGGHTILDGDGNALPQEDDLQFTGAVSVTDDNVNGRTVVNVKACVELTQAEYDALPASKLTDDIAYFIPDGESDEYKDKADKTDLASIQITGSTNNTGSTISSGTYFYLNDTLVRAKTDIANGATLTLNTNYEVVIIGALNELNPDKGNVSVTADGVKTYSQLFDTLYSLIDSSKINNKSYLTIANQVYAITNKTASQIDFGCVTVRNINGIRIKASSSEFSAFNIVTSTYTDGASSIPSNGTVIRIYY